MHPELCDRHRHLTAKHFHHPPPPSKFRSLSTFPSSRQLPSLRVCLLWALPTNGIYHVAFCVWLLSADVFKVPPACGTFQNIPFYGRIIHLIGFLKLSFQRSFSQASVWQKDLAEEGQFEHSFQFTREPRLPPRRGARSDELLSKHFDSYFPSTLTVRFSYQLEETQKDILTRKKRKSEPARSRT